MFTRTNEVNFLNVYLNKHIISFKWVTFQLLFFKLNLLPRYNWNIVESGIKHHKSKSKSNWICLIRFSKTTSEGWPLTSIYYKSDQIINWRPAYNLSSLNCLSNDIQHNCVFGGCIKVTHVFCRLTNYSLLFLDPQFS